MKKLINGVLASLILLTGITSCEQEESVEPVNERGIVINNDEAELNTRMTKKDEPIAILGDASGRASTTLTLRLRGELAPPTVDGNALQATSIARRSDYFAVSYNFRGETYAGGVDLLDDELDLKSQILFNDADISDLAFSGNNLYFVGGTSSLEQPAFVERITLKPSTGTFSLDNNVRSSVGSYVANSVLVYKSKIYVTSGNDDRNGGGLYQFNGSLSEQGYAKIKDVRWVTGYSNSVYCVSGSPDKVRVYDRTSMSKTSEFNHNGVTDAEGKMTIDVDKNLVFVAGGEEGLLVYDLEGNFITKHTFGNNSITNAVTARRGVAFISNGEGGIYVATYDPFLEIIGKLDLATDESVNHIIYHDDYLYVASGIGGVKMIQVQ